MEAHEFKNGYKGEFLWFQEFEEWAELDTSFGGCGAAFGSELDPGFKQRPHTSSLFLRFNLQHRLNLLL